MSSAASTEKRQVMWTLDRLVGGSHVCSINFTLGANGPVSTLWFVQAGVDDSSFVLGSTSSVGPARMRATSAVSSRGTVAASRASRLATSTTLSGIVFLLSYMAFHALHVAGHMPQVVARLSPVPLFATSLASALTGALAGMLGPLLLPTSKGPALDLARILALVVALFFLEILLFP